MDTQTSDIKASALELIGNTPLVALDRLHPGPGRLLAKCEFMNPGASLKDRSSLYMLRRAREEGKLNPGGPVVELTSGNQGCGLAVVCAVLGHPLTITMPAGNSIQRAIHMEALGAQCVRVPQVDGIYGSVTNADVEAATAEALTLVDRLGAYYVNQLANESNSLAHYETTGPEIWRQTGGRVDGFVAVVGTGGSFAGTSKYLKECNPSVVTIVVEPSGSEPIRGEPITKPRHLLQGSGYGVVPPLLQPQYMDDTMAVTDEEAVEYKRLLGEKEGLFVGYTSGANAAAAVRLLRSGRLPPDAWVVTMLNDSGLKYTPTVMNYESNS
ncbi:Cysteine synthase [Eumeta japonica]|uniref:Cysteine synthase n=1 Tax=Eumeta variegata TaxID=151549 RepID=A0A4C1Z0H0_EUMVA|nr:Cysteine synthase [Eumeta japonica]